MIIGGRNAFGCANINPAAIVNNTKETPATQHLIPDKIERKRLRVLRRHKIGANDLYPGVYKCPTFARKPL